MGFERSNGHHFGRGPTQPQPHFNPAEEALRLRPICIAAFIMSVHLTLCTSENGGYLIGATEVGVPTSSTCLP